MPLFIHVPPYNTNKTLTPSLLPTILSTCHLPFMYLPWMPTRCWLQPPYLPLNLLIGICVLPCCTTQILSLDCCMTYLGLPHFIIVHPYGTTQIFICRCWCNFSWICPLPAYVYPHYHIDCECTSPLFTSGCATSQYLPISYTLAVQVPILQLYPI